MHSFFNQPGDPGSSPIEPALWSDHNVKNVIFARNIFNDVDALDRINNFFASTDSKLRFMMPSMHLARNISKFVYPHGPTTGFSAICMLCNGRPKELYLTGFTFMKTPSNSLSRKVSNTYLSSVDKRDHDFEREFLVLKAMHESEKFIHLDDGLKTLVEI